jgi:hypothetical protein
LLEKGTSVAGYRIERVLGQGGMGTVYEAIQIALNRKVALKIVAAHLSMDEAFRMRFRREGQLQAAIDHPHIITVYEAGESEYGLFLAMRMVNGPTLKELVVRRELSPARALTLLKPVASALDTAHDAGLIHRDVKPQNILIARSDHAYLADFGLTKAPGEQSLTKTGQFVGTLDYVAPEQIQDEPPTAASDIYSLGAVLFESLVGSVPFAKQTDAAVLYAHLSEDPPRASERRPDLSPEVDSVILKAMAKDPGDRYAAASELMEDAARVLGGPAHAPTTVPGPAVTTTETAGPSPPPTVTAPPQRAAEPEAADVTRAAEQEGEEAQAERKGATPPTAPAVTAAASGPGEVAVAESPSSEAVTTPAGRAGSLIQDVRDRVADRVPAGAGIALVIALAVVGLGFLGYELGSSGASESEFAADSSASAGSIELGFPGDWERAGRPPQIPGIELDEAMRISPAEDKSNGLVAGNVNAEGPRLLPDAFVRRVEGGLSDGEPVELGNLEALRYQQVSLRGLDQVYSVYAIPTTEGVATLICFSDAAGQGTFLPECEDVVGTVEVSGARPYPLGPDPEYAKALNSRIEQIDSATEEQMTALNEAKTPGAQAKAAEALAAVYRDARESLGSEEVSPAAGPATAKVLGAMKDVQAAYAGLASAARSGDESAYEAASERVADGERSLEKALSGLAPLGYEVEQR